MKLTCNVCGKQFRPGNHPITNVPNGLGFPLKNGEVFHICAFCVAYRSKEGIRMIEERGGCA